MTDLVTLIEGRWPAPHMRSGQRVLSAPAYLGSHVCIGMWIKPVKDVIEKWPGEIGQPDR